MKEEGDKDVKTRIDDDSFHEEKDLISLLFARLFPMIYGTKRAGRKQKALMAMELKAPEDWNLEIDQLIARLLYLGNHAPAISVEKKRIRSVQDHADIDRDFVPTVRNHNTREVYIAVTQMRRCGLFFLANHILEVGNRPLQWLGRYALPQESWPKDSYILHPYGDAARTEAVRIWISYLARPLEPGWALSDEREAAQLREEEERVMQQSKISSLPGDLAGVPYGIKFTNLSGIEIYS